MRIRILGGGWYGCHLALALKQRGHEIELHEISHQLFNGASGGNPARLHLGFHYPRSGLTRAACQDHQKAFLAQYGFLTCAVPINIYAVAASDSNVDFITYKQVMRNELQFIEIRPEEFGLRQVEGAMLTGERHILVNNARLWFAEQLKSVVRYNTPPGNGEGFDYTVDCTFCSNDAAGVDRYEPCVTALLEGPTNKAVTIMDGPFPSIYPWNESLNLCSLTSAQYTPFSKECKTWAQAQHLLIHLTRKDISAQVGHMRAQMARFWPESIEIFKYAEPKLSIRAMPRSGSDARLVDIKVDGSTISVRAGKIDAVLYAEQLIVGELKC
jgi:hypothetical protein